MACQEFYDFSYNYVGIVCFSGMNLANKVITGIWLSIDAARAGYGAGSTKTVYMRNGEVPQYYVKDNHTAIIDEKTFALVQTKLAGRTPGQNRLSSVSIFSSKIVCGDCGGWYGPKVWHSTDKYRRVIWQCNHKFDGNRCTTLSLTEDEIKRLFLQAANIIISEREELLAIYESYMAPKLATEALEQELAELEAEINIVSGLIDSCIQENARVAIDQAAYQQKITALEDRQSAAIAKKDKTAKKIARRKARRQEIELHFQRLREMDLLTEFRDEDWIALCATFPTLTASIAGQPHATLLAMRTEIRFIQLLLRDGITPRIRQLEIDRLSEKTGQSHFLCETRGRDQNEPKPLKKRGSSCKIRYASWRM